MSSLASQLGGKAVAKDVNIPASVGTFYVVLDPIDVQRFDRFTLYLKNVGAGIVVNWKVETAPIAAGPWNFVATLPAPLAAGASSFGDFADKSLKYIRAQATSVAGTKVDIYLSAGGLE
jgi:hypothetical protein